MAENNSKRVFPADIFAEDNDKWSWSVPSINTKNSTGIPNYAALRKATKDETSSSSSSENESAFRSDSNSVKRSFRKRSSSNSEGNPLEDASSSPRQSSALPHEMVLPPSMYDDDARSASPSTYEKDLGFAASFHKEFHPLTPRSRDVSPFPSFENKGDKSRILEKEAHRRNSKDTSPNESPRRSSKADPSRSRNKKSRSISRDRRTSRRSRSRSHSKSHRTKSPMKERRRSRSKDRHVDRNQRRNSRSQSKRSHSRELKRRSRSRSRDSRRKSRSRSRESKKTRSRSRDRRRSRSRSRDYRRSRSRSYDRHQRSHYRSSSRDRYRRKHYSRSHSGSRDRSKGRSGGAMTPQMALQQTMAAMNAKAQALTGIALPKYYNPAAVNPLKYAEQVQKRKLLWQSSEKVEEQPKSSVWDKLTFAQDQDGKMTAKFRKLMGIKTENPAKEEEKESVLKKQEELFRDLDQQYEMARMTTHTQRGVGLGYSAQTLFPPIQK